MIPVVRASRRRGLRLIGCILGCLAFHPDVVGDSRLTYQVVAPGDLDLTGLSPIGREVLRKPGNWTIGQSRHFMVFAGSLPEVTDYIGQAEHAYQRAGQAFLLDKAETRKAYLVSIANNREWRRLARRHGLRKDGLAMQIGRELYLKEDTEQAKRADRIAHEVIHLRLFDAFGPRLPLWLDEGLAGYYGWLFAVEYQGRRDVILYRNQPALQEHVLLDIDALLELTDYPPNEWTARAFYRQAEELIGALSERMPPREWKNFLTIMTNQDIAPSARFRLALSTLKLDETALIKEMRARCLAPRKP